MVYRLSKRSTITRCEFRDYSQQVIALKIRVNPKIRVVVV